MALRHKPGPSRPRTTTPSAVRRRQLIRTARSDSGSLAAEILSDAGPVQVANEQEPSRPLDERAPGLVFCCAPGRIRTCDTRFRSLLWAGL